MNSKGELKGISKKRAEKYVYFYKKNYKIDEKVQPNFWRAVTEMCIDPDLDINTFGLNESEDGKWCVNSEEFGQNKIVVYEVKTIKELVEKLVKEILTLENNPVDPLDILEIKADIARISKRIGYYDTLNVPYF